MKIHSVTVAVERRDQKRNRYCKMNYLMFEMNILPGEIIF